MGLAYELWPMTLWLILKAAWSLCWSALFLSMFWAVAYGGAAGGTPASVAPIH